MKVFVFDLLAYGENLDHLKAGGTELPYPLSKQHFTAEVAMRTYEELGRLGYDGAPTSWKISGARNLGE
jgi:hypothetical protein